MTGINGLDNHLIALFDSGAVFWLALLVALGVGAAHAVAPGHGKSVTAAYLVGTRGRYRDAVRLGAIVALMHTFSVLILSLVWVGLTGAAGLGTKSVTAWLQVLAGLVVIGVGVHLTYRHLRGHGHSHDHGHGHSHSPGHSHEPVPATGPSHSHRPEPTAGLSHAHEPEPVTGHSHDHAVDGAHAATATATLTADPVTATEPGHHHHHHDAPEMTDPWSRRGLLALGLSGGLLPSPSAFLVLVSGLLTGRALDAVILVIVFGIGMAVTLTGVGVLTIRGYALLAGRARSWSPLAKVIGWVPAAAGVVVAIGGCLYLLAAITVLT
ncbi:HoxN/HupN/NixA family nickel/cobalt transporter [Micromonospora sp. NBC_01796]|uniref:HoxN/HupN/NixA family nickel/cobalt transporter n=1 Tax=Micromonospora sp. NBC_01796 TaxID=2975987 RepID=UPI002DDBAFC0|nr:hypothetical protein [Micromonospora sp. NBC_01796]WSA83768.1 hypothetical protein OIE47_25745 [Micromonospora sp. NBC_01796]